MGDRRWRSVFALALVACGKGYSEGPPLDGAAPDDAGTKTEPTTMDGAVAPSPTSDAAPRPACNLTQPFAVPAVLGGFGAITAALPSLTRDELTMIFVGEYEGSSAIFIADRASSAEPFAVAPRVIAATNLAGPETSATISADGRELIFANAPSGSYFSKLYRSTRASPATEFGVPIPLPETADVGFSQNGPSLLPDGRAMYFSAVVESEHWQIQRVTRTGAELAKPVPVAEIDAVGARQYGVTATADELTLYFSSNRALNSATANANIFVATRRRVTDPFDPPRPVDELNVEPAEDSVSWVSPDGCRIYLTSTRTGANRIYVASKP